MVNQNSILKSSKEPEKLQKQIRPMKEPIK